eukprot:1691370-Amphidinium_carterae.2
MVDGYWVLQVALGKASSDDDDDDDDESVFQAVQLLHKRNMLFLSEAQKVGDVKPPLHCTLEACLIKSRKSVLSKQAQMIKLSKAKVDSAHKALANIAGGISEGKHWCQTFAGNTFTDLLKHALNTCLKLNSTELVSKQNHLQEKMSFKHGAILEQMDSKVAMSETVVSFPWAKVTSEEELVFASVPPKL